MAGHREKYLKPRNPQLRIKGGKGEAIMIGSTEVERGCLPGHHAKKSTNTPALNKLRPETQIKVYVLSTNATRSEAPTLTHTHTCGRMHTIAQGLKNILLFV